MGFSKKDAFVDQVRLVGRDARVILDIGAHVGETTTRYLNLFPAAAIHCFEPFPDSFACLTQRFSSSGRVHPHRYAISDTIDPCALYTFMDSATYSLLQATGDAPRLASGPMDSTGSSAVESITIDEFCQRQDIKSIDILKLGVTAMPFSTSMPLSAPQTVG